MPAVFNLMTKPLGEVLEEAGLINEGQLQVVLIEQSTYCDLKIGEILALHGWLKQETADFFAERMRQLIKEETFHLQIGNFFNQAGLLTKQDIENILNEQKKTGVKFGSIAVMKGFVREQTLDFFLKYFSLRTNKNTDFQYKDKDTLTQKRLSLQKQNKTTKTADARQTVSTYLSTYFDRAMIHFTKIRSANTQSEKIEHLQGFLGAYQKIEELQMKNDPTIGQLPYHAKEQLDKVHLFVLAELQRSTRITEIR